MRQPMRGQTVIAAAVAMLMAYVAALFLLWNNDATIAKENALMENLQAGGLIAACILLIPCLMRTTSGFSRFASWSLLLVMVSMLLREVDVETLALPAPVALLGSGIGRNILLSSGFVITFVFFVRRRYELSGELIQFAWSRTGVLLAMGCAFYVASLPFDKSMLGLSSSLNQFCEEAVECGATLMFLLATVVNLLGFRAAIRTKTIEKPTPIPAGRMAA